VFEKKIEKRLQFIWYYSKQNVLK